MRTSRVISVGLFCAALTLTACETVPAAPAEMAPDAFIAALDVAATLTIPAAADRELSALIARPDLSDMQTAEAAYRRAMQRWAGAYDKPGAVEDFETFMALTPGDQRHDAVRRDIEMVKAEVTAHQARLQTLQSLPDWGSDAIALGWISEVAERYQRAGLTPSETQTEGLREAGFICASGDATATGSAVHQHGAAPEYATDLVWCTDTPIT